ncbi:MAG TPA: MATE family efflux transporter [Deltaproteobacteria bacterium]|nr:MATE family efflux transporter [Deltaproteobacteria bacterium]
MSSLDDENTERNLGSGDGPLQPSLVPGDARGGMREVAILAAPLVATQIMVTAMGVVDSAIVGRLGAAELGAVGLGGMWVWTITCFFVGTSAGVQTFVAQHHGAGRADRCGTWSWQGLASVVPLAGLAALAIFVAAEGFVAFLAPSEHIAPLATGYMRARAFGIMGITAASSLSSFFRGVGDTRTPLFATLVANVANLFLDLGLVYGWFGMPRLGVVGAGIATSISEWIYFAAIATIFLRPFITRRFHTRFHPPDLAEIKRLWRTGIPIGGQWVIEMLAFAVFTTLVARMGDAPMAASQAFIQLLSLSFMQAVGISIATTTLVGRYIGAGQLEVVGRSFRSSMILGGILAGIIATLFVVVPDRLLGIFSRDPDVLRLGGPLLVVGAFYQFFDAIAIVTDGALRGAGDTRRPFLVRCLLSWFVFLPLAYLLAFPMGWGLTGAWLGGLGAIVMLAGYLFLRFRSGAWRWIRI